MSGINKECKCIGWNRRKLRKMKFLILRQAHVPDFTFYERDEGEARFAKERLWRSCLSAGRYF